MLAEFAATFLASLALGRTGHARAIPVASCLIVELPFIALARMLDETAYRWTVLARCCTAVLRGALCALALAALVSGIDRSVRRSMGIDAAVVSGSAGALVARIASTSEAIHLARSHMAETCP